MQKNFQLKPSILIVDDDPDIGIALGDWLRQEGYSVHIVEYGKAGIDAFKLQVFNLVILDLGLPDMDGLEVLKHMKASNPRIPIIILTAFSFFERTTTRHDFEGIFAYLKKPYDRQEIKTTIGRALQFSLDPSAPFLGVTK